MAEATGTSAGVVVVGSVSADLTTFSKRLPARGETVLGEDFSMVLGGKGANQAVAAAKAGAAAAFVGCVGTDVFAEVVMAGLRNAGVDVGHVREVAGPTGIAHIRVDDSAENDIVVVPLANTRLSADQVDDALEALSASASVLLTQLETPIDLVLHAIRSAAERGMTVVLDPAPAAELPDDNWVHVDVVTPNESEAHLLTGIEVHDAETAARAGRWFLDHGVRAAVITLSSAGSVVVTATGAEVFEPFDVDAVDSTAAGDAFAGYLGTALAEGRPLSDAIRTASAAGALAVTRRGASPSIPVRAEVEAMVASASA